MKRWIGYLVLGVCFSLFALSPGTSQTTFGSITGVVTDPSGAVIPGAKVTVISEGQGMVRSAITGNGGAFSVPNLSVGPYRLQVSSSGFAQYDRSGLNLSANEVLNVNVQLTVAQAGTTVHVTSQSSISTATTNISNIKTARDLAQLPSITRQQGDQGVTPFVLMNPGASSTNGNALPKVGGVRQIAVIPTMDGIQTTTNETGQGAGPIQPSQDAVQEINVQLANTPAEFSTPTSITMVTKSGTNGFHGSAYWQYNGDALNTRNYFSSTVPFRVYNDFAGSVGGPIRKDKTFFFGDYEASRESAYGVVTATAPLVPWRTGNFSGQSKPVVDPSTGKPFPGNMIPSDRISAVSQKLQDYFYPTPNFGSPTLLSGNWRGQFPSDTGWTHFDSFDVRIDQNFHNGDKVFGRFSYRHMPRHIHMNFLPPVGELLEKRYGTSTVLSWTHLFSPALLNELRGGLTRQNLSYNTNLIGSDIVKQVGIQGVSTVGLYGIPSISVTGITGTGAPNNLGVSINTTFQYTDNLSWNRGPHSMKFGFDVIRTQIGGYTDNNTIYGSYNFTGIYSGTAYADFLLGIPQVTQLVNPTIPLYLRGTAWSLYAQDEYKVTPRLTLNYGLRWELNGPYYDINGTLANFDPDTGSWVVPDKGFARVNPRYPANIPITTVSMVHYPENGLVNLRKLNFYPRIGVAYQLFHNSVIRAAYGIYSVPVYGGLARSISINGGPFSGTSYFNNAIKNGVPLFSFPQPFLPAGTTASQSAFGVSPNFVTPYTQQWNLTLERLLGEAALRLSYVGSHGVKMVGLSNLNQPAPSTTKFTPSMEPYPLFSGISWYDNSGGDEYNALEVAVAKNYGKNLTFNAGWTWAKDLTNAQDGGAFASQKYQNRFDPAADYGNSLLTPTHRVFGYAVYQLPFGRGQRFLNSSSRLTQGVLGGWQMAWNVLLQSGQFFTPAYSAFDSSNTNTIGGRPDVVPGVSTKPIGKQSITNWFNPAAFKVPGCPDTDTVCAHPANVGRFGNSSVGSLRGPAIYNADLALSKYFNLYERARLQFQSTMVDVFNHPDFALPASNISASGSVGQITSQIAPSLGTAVGRQITFALRLEF